MRVGILTSSRADFGIYLPLLKALNEDDFFDVQIIAFGTHLSPYHGYTLNQIESEGFEVKYKVDSMLAGDTAGAIASAIGLTAIKFASFWEEHSTEFDAVFCLGDRYEMFAAVSSGVPFQIKFIHLHGGEKTLGAIDNVFRHGISHASTIHFSSTDIYVERLRNMLDETSDIYNIGAMSLDNLKQIQLLSKEEFTKKWGVNFNIPTILVTFHPETVNSTQNADYARELVKVITTYSDYQFLITMPNADTAGSVIRHIFIEALTKLTNVFMIENLGTQSYFSAMRHCLFLMGNTSSGIIEAASFEKYVINLGNRQEGRASGANVFNVPIDFVCIGNIFNEILKNSEFKGGNIYYKDNSSGKAIEILKQIQIREYAN